MSGYKSLALLHLTTLDELLKVPPDTVAANFISCLYTRWNARPIIKSHPASSRYLNAQSPSSSIQPLWACSSLAFAPTLNSLTASSSTRVRDVLSWRSTSRWGQRTMHLDFSLTTSWSRHAHGSANWSLGQLSLLSDKPWVSYLLKLTTRTCLSSYSCREWLPYRMRTYVTGLDLLSETHQVGCIPSGPDCDASTIVQVRPFSSLPGPWSINWASFIMSVSNLD